MALNPPPAPLALTFARKNFNGDFLILSLAVIFINIPLFGLLKIPIHDTATIFSTFYYYYSQWFYYHEIPQWSPFNAYGMPSHYVQVFSLSPINFITIFVGSIFKVKNTLLLFQASMIAEQLIFLMGFYLLSRLLYQHRLTVFIVSLTAGLSSVWYSQISLNFRLFYLFPLSVFLLILFFKKMQPGFLWLACIVSLTSLMGNTQYFAGFILLTHLIIATCYFLKDKRSVQKVFSLEKVNIFTFGVFIVLAAAYFLFLYQIISNVALRAGGRGGAGTVALDDFLKFGGVSSIKEIVQSFLLGAPAFLNSGSGYDNTVYIGIFSIILFIWAVLHVRKFDFYVFLILLALMALFSRGGIVASLFYHFPLMNHFRHIGLIYGFIKILVIICAGYGLDHLIRETHKSIFYWGKIIFLVLIVMYYAVHIGNISLSIFVREFSSPSARIFICAIAAVLILILTLGRVFCERRNVMLSFKMRTPFVLSGLIIFAVFLDLLSFQTAIKNEIKTIDIKKYNLPEIVLAKPMTFQERRGFLPEEGRAKDAYAFVSRTERVNQSIYDFDFVQYDSCLVLSRYDLMSQGVRQLENINQGVLAVVAACGAPKLRLLTNLRIFDSEEDILNLYKKIDNVMTALIVRDGNTKLQAITKTSPAFYKELFLLKKDALGYSQDFLSKNDRDAGNISVKEFTANKINLSVNVKAPKGAWLLYVDAYHPGWQAFVNGKKTEIKRAYLAFKSIYLNSGEQRVSFVFNAGLGSVLSVFFSIIGALVGFIFLMSFITTFFINITQR